MAIHILNGCSLDKFYEQWWLILFTPHAYVWLIHIFCFKGQKKNGQGKSNKLGPELGIFSQVEYKLAY